VQRITDAWSTPRGEEVLRREYPTLESVSIDHAIMEHARDILVVQAPYRWDDVGSWLALERMQAQDGQGNTVQGIHCGIETKNCVVVGEPGRLIATIGVNDLLIIQDGDCTLVAHRKDEETVKQMVEELRRKGLERFL
jgi:mannose-1-phosphate guanylyltransferase